MAASLCTPCAVAQDETETKPVESAEDAEPTAPAELAPPVIREAPLQILLQRNAQGELVPTPLFAPNDSGQLKQHVLSAPTTKGRASPAARCASPAPFTASVRSWKSS
jgi:hypothetical protein